MATFWRYYDRFVAWLETLGQGDWFILLVAVLVAGALCLRGFGSRKTY